MKLYMFGLIYLPFCIIIINLWLDKQKIVIYGIHLQMLHIYDIVVAKAHLSHRDIAKLKDVSATTVNTLPSVLSHSRMLGVSIPLTGKLLQSGRGGKFPTNKLQIFSRTTLQMNSSSTGATQ